MQLQSCLQTSFVLAMPSQYVRAPKYINFIYFLYTWGPPKFKMVASFCKNMQFFNIFIKILLLYYFNIVYKCSVTICVPKQYFRMIYREGIWFTTKQ